MASLCSTLRRRQVLALLAVLGLLAVGARAAPLPLAAPAPADPAAASTVQPRASLRSTCGGDAWGEIQAKGADPLPSWQEGPSKRAIRSFVEQVSTPGSPAFVPPAERIATFDNDGTLWAEKPVYAQVLFAVDRVKALASQHPAWSHQEPFASALRGDLQRVLASGERGIAELVMATHAGMTTEAFEQEVCHWIVTARHPSTGRPFTAMVYQPMLELLAYLRGRGFKTFIVSGGGVDFMRPWAESTYGIPPEQVIGSSILTRFELRDGLPVLVRLPRINVINDKEGKPVGIHQHIGRRPLAAFGNSDGDLAMLQWTMAAPGPRFALLVHHTDGQREWAYDRASAVGRLDRALAEARRRGWTVVDMQRDWQVVFPPAPPMGVPQHSPGGPIR